VGRFRGRKRQCQGAIFVAFNEKQIGILGLFFHGLFGFMETHLGFLACFCCIELF
jgi:hypothetical protein